MDIFSLGVIMYELFVMNLVAIINHKSGEAEEYENYARRVAAGYREKLRDTWPQALKARRQRSCACVAWQRDACARMKPSCGCK